MAKPIFPQELEITPTDGPGQWLPVFRRFDKIDATLATIVNEQLRSAKGFEQLQSRVRNLELQRVWFPTFLSLLAILIACYSLAKGHG